MIKKDQKVGNILGVSLYSTHKRKVLEKVLFDIKSEDKLLIVTPNPEIVLRAQEDKLLMSILNRADISIADGIGLVAWHKFLHLPNPKDPFKRALTLFVQALGVSFSIMFSKKWLFSDLSPLKGRDVAYSLVELAHKKGLKLFLLGGEHGEARKAQLALKKNFPSLKVSAFAGPMLNSGAKPISVQDTKLEKMAISKINSFAPDILLVGMTTPRQEKWLYQWLPKVNAKVGMTVGGTFKYFGGDEVLPPKWIDDLGLAWLFRLLSGAQSVDRITKAVWEFPAKVFWYKFTH